MKVKMLSLTDKERYINEGPKEKREEKKPSFRLVSASARVRIKHMSRVRQPQIC